MTSAASMAGSGNRNTASGIRIARATTAQNTI